MPGIRKAMKREISLGYLSQDINQTPQTLRYNRKIKNRDGETCWLNSSIQMILTALDFSPNFTMFSPLGTLLGMAQMENMIDPTSIKTLIQDEVKENAVRFQYILSEQQCARDALVILTENKSSWMDVWNLLSHKMRQTIEWQDCDNKSYKFDE